MAKQNNKAKVTLAQSAAPQVAAPAAPVAAPAAPVAAPVKGAATSLRWGAALRGNTHGTAVTTGAHIKALPVDTIITVLATVNPKGRNSATRFNLYGANGQAGHTLTIAQYIAAQTKHFGVTKSAGAVTTLALADIAWDFNHGFIGLCAPGAANAFVRGVVPAVAAVQPATQLQLPAPTAQQAAA